jgi:hypothetical protein
VGRHAALHEVGRGRSGTVRGADARVVLAAAPREANARVADRVSLHLVDGHLGRVAVNELNETAALARGDLDVGDLAESLEERTELILRDIAGQATDEDRGVVRVSELVHGLHGLVGRSLLVIEGSRDTPAHGAGGGGTSNLRDHLTGSRSVTAGATVLVRAGSYLLARRSNGKEGREESWEETHRVLGVAVEMRMGRLPQ